MKDETKPFLKARFLGARFEGKRLPISVLPELNVYIQLIQELARHLFLTAHKDRQRAPKGFLSSFEPALTGIEQGSAVAIVERSHEPSLFPEHKDYFERAHDLIAETIHQVARGEKPPESFPLDFFRRFNMFGKSLRKDESIELRPGSMPHGVNYTTKVRKELVLKHSETYQQEIEVIGPVVKVDVEKNQFTVRTDPNPVTTRYSKSDENEICAALKDHETMDISFSGVATFDRLDRIIKIEDIKEVTLFESLRPYRNRLEDLRALPGGWLDGGGQSPTREAILSAEIFQLVLEKTDVSVPFLYPTPEGGLQAEWSVQDKEVEVTLCFEPDGALLLVWTGPDLEGEEKMGTTDAELRNLARILNKLGVAQGEQ